MKVIIKMEWSGRTTLHKHKFDNWKKFSVTEEDKKCLTKVNFLDVQWSTCPVEVENQVKELWTEYDLGNDHSFIKTSINELKEIAGDVEYEEDPEEVEVDFEPIKTIETNAIIQYLIEQGITDHDEVIIIHWWW
jgi:hypothetical protein